MPQPAARVLHLADIKPTDHAELLVEIIQNKSGKISKDESEQALVQLLHRFAPLIENVVKTLYFQKYELYKVAYELEDFLQEVRVMFCYLTLEDFESKEHPDDNSRAVFANYMKNKLYWRMRDWIQNQFRKGHWNSDVGTDFQVVDNDYVRHGPRDHRPEVGKFAGEADHEVKRAIISNALHYDNIVLDHMTGDDQRELINTLIEISNTKLDERDRKVWYLNFFTGLTQEEIGLAVKSKVDTKPISRTRVAQIAFAANETVLAELGRRAGIRRAAL